MREHLFKGKRIDNGGWVYGGICCFPDGRIAILQHNDIGKQYVDCHFQVDPSTVGQFTGLTDKNDTKIFEGDILEDTLGWIYEVHWDNDNGRFLGHHRKPRGDTYICYVGREPKSKIIGNIYDEVTNE